MAFRITTLTLTVIASTALASACSSAGDQSNQGQGVTGSGGFGTNPFGNAGNGTTNTGGATFGGNGGFSSGGFNGTGGDSNVGNAGNVGGFGDSGNVGGFGNVGNGGTTGAGADGNGGTSTSDGGAQNTGGEGGGGTGPAPTSDSASKQGTCTVANYSTGVAAGADYVNPVVYYPSGGGCDGPFPGVALIPGWTEQQSAVNQWGTFLASHGFVVISVDTAVSGVANTLTPQPPGRALGLYEAVTTLKGENTRQGSPLNGKLNTSLMAVMGHSMGGGGTMLAANDHSDLKAAIGLCPWNPGITYPKDTVPSLFFDGTADTLVPPNAAIAEYNSIPSGTPKIYAEFNGGTHYVANTPLGAAATDKVVARIGLSWLEVHVVGDTRYQQFIVKDAATMSNWMP